MYQIDYNEIEEDIFKAQNECRKNPFNYIIKLKEISSYFNDKIYQHPNEDPITTYEGADSIEDAMQYLKSLKTYPPLEYSEEISKACRDHIADIGPKGLTTHEGSDGSNITDRIEKYCEWDGMVAENLDFGFRIGENVIMNMIIDDGIKERIQRKNIFNKEFNYVGIGAGPHKIYGICVVIGYAKNVRQIGSQPINVIDRVKKFYGDEKKEEEIANNHLNNNNETGNNNTTMYNMNYNMGTINEFKFMEPDAPESSVSLKIMKKKIMVNGKEKKFTKKTFLLKNGINHIVEIEEELEKKLKIKKIND